MKATTATAIAMSDVELHATRARLAREIPAAQALYDAVKREQARRKRAARQQRILVRAAAAEQLDLIGTPSGGLSPLSHGAAA
ncbi:MAG: hypothetical protein ACTHK2_13855 [Dokdonella sp.]|uniref:hypothetical protein n=1 Tax=Dokdonella sp. TaxID=2291710 RepID=UPI003F7D689D